MPNTEADLDSDLSSQRTNKLLNWVNTWKPAIAASVKSACVLAASTLRRMDEHFGYLTPSAKRPARSRVPPQFHTRHDRNRTSRRRLWKAPPCVRPLSANFAQIPTNKNQPLLPSAPSNTQKVDPNIRLRPGPRVELATALAMSATIAEEKKRFYTH
jgi:hypothetical protein